MTETLRGCPFCGASPEPKEGMGEAWVLCMRCGATGPATGDPASAAHQWNQRPFVLAAPPDVLPAAEEDRPAPSFAQEAALAAVKAAGTMGASLINGEVYRRALDVAGAIHGMTPEGVCDWADKIASERERRGGK